MLHYLEFLRNCWAIWKNFTFTRRFWKNHFFGIKCWKNDVPKNNKLSSKSKMEEGSINKGWATGFGSWFRGWSRPRKLLTKGMAKMGLWSVQASPECLSLDSGPSSLGSQAQYSSLCMLPWICKDWHVKSERTSFSRGRCADPSVLGWPTFWNKQRTARSFLLFTETREHIWVIWAWFDLF